ncbi:MAG: MBL fold metallo-hydrolase, partial [Gemmatimonadetes bacterium]
MLASVLRAGVAGAPPPASAQQGEFVRLDERTWAFIDGGDASSNGAILAGRDAALVVDPGLTPAGARRLLAQAETLSGVPVRWVVLTHWHPDHALGVTCLGYGAAAGGTGPAARAAQRPTVLAHPYTRRRLAEEAARTARSLARSLPADTGMGACRVHLPDAVVDTARWIDLGGRRVRVFHPGRAHTPGDLVVWDPDGRTLAAGDEFMHASSPSMGEGSAFVWRSVLDGLVALEPRHVVAGHFGPSTP